MKVLKDNVLEDKAVTVFLGPYGSGKTEIAVNYAVQLASHRRPGTDPVWLVDLDLVTPYFRVRDLDSALLSSEVKVAAPPATDLPMPPAGVSGLLRRGGPGVVDVGGGENGARMLGSLRQAVPTGHLRVWLVFNPFRPGCGTVPGLVTAARKVATASRLDPTGVVSNPNLGTQTTPDHVHRGHGVVVEAARELGLPLIMLTVLQDLAPAVEKDIMDPIFPLRRFFPLPWE